jgi:hypothetical protein
MIRVRQLEEKLRFVEREHDNLKKPWQFSAAAIRRYRLRNR